MNRITRSYLIDQRLLVACLAVPCTLLGTLLLSAGQAHSASPVVVAGELMMAVLAQQTIDPTKVLGNQSCQECHKSELAAWQQSSHAKKSFSMLVENPKAAIFADKMGISKSNLTGESVCTNCHGTRQTEAGAAKVAQGVSCEMCHGPSGPKGPNGWFTPHGDYGSGVKDRAQETAAHHDERMKLVKQLGKNGSDDIYALAKNCYACHSVPNEKLVNAAGHPGLNAQFEFLQWAQGEVRHNMQLNQSQNAEVSSLWLDPLWHGAGRTAAGRKRQMYVVGQLVELETSLRNRASATLPGAFSTGAAARVLVANGKLMRINATVPIDEVKAATGEVTKVQPKLFLPPAANQKALFEAAADKVAAAAKQFAATHDGSKLAAMDALLPAQGKGEVFKP